MNVIKLIFVFAHKKELPIKFIQNTNIPIFYTKQLIKYNQMPNISSSVIILISGIGKNNAIQTAKYISQKIQPLFVVNIGSAGISNAKTNLNTWISPKFLTNNEKKIINNAQELPFPLKRNINIKKISTLTTLDTPLMSFLSDVEYVDMEAYWLGKILIQNKISFHVIKYTTDYCNQNSQHDYLKNIINMRAEIINILNFLKKDSNFDISVIIPTYNRANKLQKTLDSILSQSYKPSEIIVVDDGSTDQTKSLLKSYQNSINSIFIKQNRGVSYARNQGLKIATSNWICFCDSDDIWTKDKLKKQVNFLKQHPFYEITQPEEIWIKNGKRINPHKHHLKKEGWLFEKSLQLCSISPSGVMINSSLFQTFGYFDENLPACEDYDLWLRISRYKPIGLSPEKTVIKYGGHKDQLSTKYIAMDRFRIWALHKALKNESNNDYKILILDTLFKKLEILIKGHIKRINS